MMMYRLFILLILLVALCSVPELGFADTNNLYEELNCENQIGPLPTTGDERYYLMSYAYRCMDAMLANSIDDIAKDVFAGLKNAILAIFTLAIILFGMKIAIGASPRLKSEAVMMLVKFTFITILLFSFELGGEIYEIRQDAIDMGDDLVTVAFDGSLPVQDCSTPNSDEDFPGGYILFRSGDCLLVKLLGAIKDDEGEFKLDDDPENNGFVMLALIGGLLFTGPLGAHAASGFLALIAIFVMAFAKAMYLMIVAAVALTFLFMLTPVVLPLALFQQTSDMFNAWWRQIVSYILQPFILTVFMAMMLSVIGVMMDDIEEVAETANNIMNNPNSPQFFTPVTSQSRFKEPTREGLANTGGSQVCGNVFSPSGSRSTVSNPNQKLVEQQTVGCSTVSFNMRFMPFDLSQVDEITVDVLKLLIVFVVMYWFLKELPSMMAELAGGDRLVPSLMQVQPMQGLENFGRGAQQRLDSGLRSLFK